MKVYVVELMKFETISIRLLLFEGVNLVSKLFLINLFRSVGIRPATFEARLEESLGTFISSISD
jgi:hypothetical protein